MSINDETLRILTDLQVTVTDITDTETRALVRSWARAWDQIAAEWESVASEVLSLQANGQIVTPATARRLERARQAVQSAHAQILGLVESSAARVTNAAGELVDVTRLLDARLTASQLPAAAGNTADLSVRFTRVSDQALASIVERTTQQITSRAWPLADDATEAMLRELTRAVPEGLSPREAARRIVKAVEGRFNGGLSRALTISRTEIIDASRAAAAQNQAGNADVLGGWVWLAELGSRTCPACVAMHGSVHSLEEQGPEGHQNCRCSRMPQTKTWRQLGFDVDEPPSTVTSGPDWFAGQPETVQLAIMGPTRLRAVNDGTPFSDLVQRRTTPGWRDSLVPVPAGQFAA
jgi:SPP1 gp7 family putative phage head morphogenesis protein